MLTILYFVPKILTEVGGGGNSIVLDKFKTAPYQKAERADDYT